MVAADKSNTSRSLTCWKILKKSLFSKCCKVGAALPENIGDEYSAILELLPKQGIEIYSASWLAEKLLEQDKLALSFVQGKTEPGIFEK